MNAEQPNFLGNKFVWFVGTVEDINDPLKLGRIRVRILGHHTPSKTDISVADLQWAFPLVPIHSAGMSGIGQTPFGLLNGSWVMGFFRDSQSCQEPVIVGAMFGDVDEEPDYGQGFSDPDKIYPRYNKETGKGKYPVTTDINPLALLDMEQFSPIAWRKDTRIKKIQIAWPFSSYEEPETPWNPAYPKNHVRETESGHIEEFDDTPGIERIHRMHRSGTFEEILPDGTKITRILGDDYTIVLHDNNIAIQGNLNITVQGDATLITNGNVEQRVKGDYNIAVDGNYSITTKGDYNLKADGDIKTSADKNQHHFSGADTLIGADGMIVSNAKGINYIAGAIVHFNSASTPPVPDPGDAIADRRTAIPSDLIDDSHPDDILEKINDGDTQDRVTFKTSGNW